MNLEKGAVYMAHSKINKIFLPMLRQGAGLVGSNPTIFTSGAITIAIVLLITILVLVVIAIVIMQQ